MPPAPASRRSCSVRDAIRGNQRPSRGHQEAINETHLLEKELLGGRDGALRLEIAARLMREAIRGVIRGVIRGNLRQSEAIGGNPRQSGRRAKMAARLGVQFYLQTLLQRGARGGDCGLWQKRVGTAAVMSTCMQGRVLSDTQEHEHTQQCTHAKPSTQETKHASRLESKEARTV